MDEKKSGSYYTPECVVRFMVNYLAAQGQNFAHVLEPSAGDGRFLPELLRQPNCHVDAVEKFEAKTTDMRTRIQHPNARYYTADFLDYSTGCEERYDLIIGNPPYISMKNMETEEIEKARQLFEQVQLSTAVMQNLWSAFVVGAAQLLTPNGTVFFILPTEFLQVRFAEKLRLYLEKKFNNIKIFSFEAEVFPDIEQHICLVYLSNSENAPPHIDYYIYGSPEDALPLKHSRIEKNKPLKKWNNAILDDEEILLLRHSGQNCVKIGEIGNCAPGIVTGGNKYFIVKPSFVREKQAAQYVLPIIQKNSIIRKDTIFFNDALFQTLADADIPVYLLNLAGKENIPTGVTEYLKTVGEEKTNGIKLKERHKCSNREPWYAVPIVHYGDVVFFKRSDKLPHLYINEQRIHTTDAGYHIRLNEEYDPASVVFCFYNSLTLAQCEFQGRYYGGGVLELVPNEFRELSLPYTHISKDDVQKLDNMFCQQIPLSQIIAFVNERTLAGWLQEDTIRALNNIREKLMRRRLTG